MKPQFRLVKKQSDLFPPWSFDGSSTYQATTYDSEITLKPIKVVKCPFRNFSEEGSHVAAVLVLCETLKSGIPHSTNTRHEAMNIFSQQIDFKPLFGIEQEYFMRDAYTDCVLGFVTYDKKIMNEIKQGNFYCGIGPDIAIGREISDAILNNLLYSGLTVAGVNGEVAPGQWEYQIGPACGIDAADQLWLSRYIATRTAESFSIIIDYSPKPQMCPGVDVGIFNGSGCHTNFSTKPMRCDGGLEVIKKAIKKLEAKHDEHIKKYGEDNEKRLTGSNETSNYKTFKFGVADRTASVRISESVIMAGCGYFEDRRPAANMDPYVVTSMIFKTCCTDDIDDDKS